MKWWLVDNLPLGAAFLKLKPDTKKDLAAQEGYKLKERIKRKVGYAKMMEYGGLGEEALIKKHRELLNAKRVIHATDAGKITDVKEFDDGPTQMAALRHANELHGHIMDKKAIDLTVHQGRRHWTEVLKDAEDGVKELPEGRDEDE